MIVDDSDTIRSVLVRTIGMTKLPVDEIIQAVNGADAIEKLKTTFVDIVFSDIHMPEMDGITMFQNMKKNPELSEIPVVIISTEGSTTRINELMAMGIKGYLRKPFTPEKIRDVIIQTLGEWS
jgi:two-component system chemotaxis response regulator CheY